MNGGCKHSKLKPMLTLVARKKIGGGNLAWCSTCGSVRHIDIDGREGWATPTYRKKGVTFWQMITGKKQKQ